MFVFLCVGGWLVVFIVWTVWDRWFFRMWQVVISKNLSISHTHTLCSKIPIVYPFAKMDSPLCIFCESSQPSAIEDMQVNSTHLSSLILKMAYTRVCMHVKVNCDVNKWGVNTWILTFKRHNEFIKKYWMLMFLILNME